MRADRRTALKRLRLLGFIVVGLLSAWVLAGFTRVAAPGDVLVVRAWLGGGARVLGPGWWLIPPGIARRIEFPLGVQDLGVRVGRPGGAGEELSSREGAHLFCSGALGVVANKDRAGALARSFPAGWDPRGAASILEGILWGPVSRHTRTRSLSDLLKPAAGAGLRDVVSDALAKAGLSVAGDVRLKFYPSGTTGVSAGAGRDVRRVLLIGLDGADWKIIDPLIAVGRMPHLEEVIRSGARARLRTITPTLSPIVWTSIATGVGPQRHGILDFIAPGGRTGQSIPVTSSMRRVKAIWNMVSGRRRTAGIIAWWASWPAEKVDGFVVSDRVAYQLFGFDNGAEMLRKRVFPEALAQVIDPFIVSPSRITDAEVGRFIPAVGPGPDMTRKVQELKTNLASTRTYLSIGMDLLAAYDPDLKAIYFEGTDTIAHEFMRYRRPQMAHVSPEDIEAFSGVVDAYYEYIDEVIGKLLSLADERTVVVICSDHGFRTGRNRPVVDPRIGTGGAAEWHRRFGILVMRGPGVRRGVTLDVASVLDITPTILAIMGLPVARDMEGEVIRGAFETPPAPARIASYEEPGSTGGAEPEASAIDAEILEKLSALGYLSGQGSNALNNTGITLMDRGRYAEAAKVFRMAIEQQPGFLAARINLGRARMLMKDLDGALETLAGVLKVDGNRVEVHDLIGNIHMTRGEFDLAESSLRRALAIDPDDTDARNTLGLLYEKMSRDDDAIAQYRRLLAIDPDYAEGYNNIGIIYRKQGKPEKAITFFERAIKADPRFVGSYNNMGLAYQDMGRMQEAKAALQRGLKIDADNAVMLNSLGT
ncbi:MAG: tetratricopeptide repeat protein, partial [Acidobacteriota bacterium]